MSLLVVFLVCFFVYNTNLPLVASRGSAPNGGTGSRRWPWGAPPGGPPGPTRHRAPGSLPTSPKHGPGGVLGGPLGGPLGGSLWGPGGLRGGPGAPPGGGPPVGPPGGRTPYGQYCPSGSAPQGASAPRGPTEAPALGGTPRGAPWWPPSLRTILPFWSRPPGGHFWGVRTRWGQNQAKSSLTVVYRGGRGPPPKAHWVRSLQGGPKRAQF
jgi:hypothetical protein